MATNQYRGDGLLDAVGVDPIFAHKMKAVMSDLRGHGGKWLITQVLRTHKEQMAKYAQGRTKPGPVVTWVTHSLHEDGIACDVVPLIDGVPRWDAPKELWALVGSAAKAHDLVWGGTWKKKDLPHVQFPQ